MGTIATWRRVHSAKNLVRISIAALVGVSTLAGCAGIDSPQAAGHAESPTIDDQAVDDQAVDTHTGGSSVGADDLDASSSRRDIVAYALRHHPALAAAYQRWLAAGQRAPQVASLPDPQVTFGYFLEEVETRVGPQRARFGIRQHIPWPGTLSGRAAAATHATDAEWNQLQALRLEIEERVRVALDELYYLDRATAITRDNLTLLESFEEVIRVRYRVGSGSHPALIRAQVQLGLLRDRVAELESLRPTYVAELNESLNRPAAAAFDTVPAPTDEVCELDPAELLESAIAMSPVLRAIDARIAESRELERVARASGYPEVTIGADYIETGRARTSGVRGSGDDPVMLSLGISLPIWRGKVRAAEREATARRLATASERVDRQNSLATRLHRMSFEHRDADRRVRLYRETLIPKAEESLHASLAAFRVGEGSFLEVLDAERSLLEFQVAVARAVADRAKSLARLRTLVGGRLQPMDEDRLEGRGEHQR